jgi:CubicO group peptidase (beta-lactamase class C family)
MSLILCKNRRDLLKLGATSLLGAGALAAVPAGAFAAPAPKAKAPRGAVPMTNGRFKAIDAELAKGVADGTVAGVVGMVANQNGLLYEGSVGRRDLSKSAGMSPDTVFWLLSMTKAITATACMQLVEQGRLKLDQRMADVLPELGSPKVLEGFDAQGQPRLRPARRDVTLRHLLTHTSGYTYANWSDRLGQFEKVTGMPDVAYSKNGALLAPLEFDPGERWQYGIGMDIVGKMIEAVTDQSLEVYFRENIFAPLGMTSTGFLIGSEQRRRAATTYSRQADGSLKAMPFEMSQRPEFFSGGGGLFGTPRDYMAFLQMLVRDGTFNGARVLKPETVMAMRQNQIGDLNVNPLKSSAAEWSSDADLFPGIDQKWGFSFDINTRPGANGRSAGSYTWAGLLNCYFWVDPVKKVTGALFSQLLPFYDARAVELYGAFERGVYAGLDRA